MVKILSKDLWKNIVMHMPIPAKDLLFYSDKKGLLMGKRINKPAKDYYFVPGGRVFKNENRNDSRSVGDPKAKGGQNWPQFFPYDSQFR